MSIRVINVKGYEKNAACNYLSKDIQLITAKGPRSVRYLMQKIKASLNKPPDSMITIDEFCVYAGIEKQDINHLIN